MTDEQRSELIRLLEQGEDISREWARIIFPPEKLEYELVYYGKERIEDIIANTMAVPLQQVRTFNKGDESWRNMLVFGDNLQVMKSLLEQKKTGKLCNADGTSGVKLVYIDPPFASKQEFQGSQDQKAYQDKIIGAQFVEFVRKRLVLLRELLSDDGCIYVHLDPRKNHYLKVVLDEIFGEEHFQNEIVWQRSTAHNMKAKGFVRSNDHILLYSKSGQYTFNGQYVEYSKAQLNRYKKDENGKLYKAENLTFSSANSSRQFEWRGTKPPANRSWGASHEQLEQWWAEGRILTKKDGSPRLDGLKIYLEDTAGGNRVSTNWTDIDRIGNTSSERLDYPTQKPESLLERIIRTSSGEGDIVLDAFAGSGTTCAVAEKLGRRWIGIDCGKLAIYTVQKRLLNLKVGIGNKRGAHKTRPFTLYNAGLYDFSRLKELPWEEWRRFALTLFGCRDEPHRIGGIQFDGTLKACPVQVFDHRQHFGATVSEDTLRSIHEAAGSRIGGRMFIIAPSLAFDFQQDYVQIDEVRYYALRIPYSIIHELHQREFMALKQPADEMAVNDTVDAVGFDFIRTPDTEYTIGLRDTEAFIRIDRFYSDAVVREPMKKRGNRESLSMVMLDYDYDAETDVFDLDDVFYAGAIEANAWEVRFATSRLGGKIMAVFVDIYGNEARSVISASDFGLVEENGPAQKETLAKPMKTAEPSTKKPTARRKVLA